MSLRKPKVVGYGKSRSKYLNNWLDDDSLATRSNAISKKPEPASTAPKAPEAAHDLIGGQELPSLSTEGSEKLKRKLGKDVAKTTPESENSSSELSELDELPITNPKNIGKGVAKKGSQLESAKNIINSATVATEPKDLATRAFRTTRNSKAKGLNAAKTSDIATANVQTTVKPVNPPVKAKRGRPRKNVAAKSPGKPAASESATEPCQAVATNTALEKAKKAVTPPRPSKLPDVPSHETANAKSVGESSQLPDQVTLRPTSNDLSQNLDIHAGQESALTTSDSLKTVPEPLHKTPEPQPTERRATRANVSATEVAANMKTRSGKLFDEPKVAPVSKAKGGRPRKKAAAAVETTVQDGIAADTAVADTPNKAVATASKGSGEAKRVQSSKRGSATTDTADIIMTGAPSRLKGVKVDKATAPKDAENEELLSELTDLTSEEEPERVEKTTKAHGKLKKQTAVIDQTETKAKAEGRVTKAEVAVKVSNKAEMPGKLQGALRSKAKVRDAMLESDTFDLEKSFGTEEKSKMPAKRKPASKAKAETVPKSPSKITKSGRASKQTRTAKSPPKPKPTPVAKGRKEAAVSKPEMVSEMEPDVHASPRSSSPLPAAEIPEESFMDIDQPVPESSPVQTKQPGGVDSNETNSSRGVKRTRMRPLTTQDDIFDVARPVDTSSEKLNPHKRLKMTPTTGKGLASNALENPPSPPEPQTEEKLPARRVRMVDRLKACAVPSSDPILSESESEEAQPTQQSVSQSNLTFTQSQTGLAKITYARTRSYLADDEEDLLQPQTVLDFPSAVSDTDTGPGVRSIHELRAAGRTDRFLRDAEGLIEEITTATSESDSQRKALVQLAKKLLDKDFAERFSTYGFADTLSPLCITSVPSNPTSDFLLAAIFALSNASPPQDWLIRILKTPSHPPKVDISSRLCRVAGLFPITPSPEDITTKLLGMKIIERKLVVTRLPVSETVIETLSSTGDSLPEKIIQTEVLTAWNTTSSWPEGALVTLARLVKIFTKEENSIGGKKGEYLFKLFTTVLNLSSSNGRNCAVFAKEGIVHHLVGFITRMFEDEEGGNDALNNLVLALGIGINLFEGDDATAREMGVDEAEGLVLLFERARGFETMGKESQGKGSGKANGSGGKLKGKARKTAALPLPLAEVTDGSGEGDLTPHKVRLGYLAVLLASLCREKKAREKTCLPHLEKVLDEFVETYRRMDRLNAQSDLAALQQELEGIEEPELKPGRNLTEKLQHVLDRLRGFM
ncbi:hypothetical protein K470DRAFT_257472 [Piedraia hortae CBS 480.64]|uniref:Wings apart-like protein C-terminal domain-containing protein n=1 Tax=Piedraia hortae CBS 480.64 TaxID=1314780 RepID=A0A6A7C0K6_9PEZI|nr:hypothetical protein K470DRAFT_257472 [Piedraia hortae CBS 480.64]